MTQETPGRKSWNLFARELAAILQKRHPALGLGHLDDRTTIHREKVRRLRLSLEQPTPTHLPVLNPDDLEQVVATFELTEEEEQQLQAALLVTAIERMLLERIAPAAALEVAEQMLPLIKAGLAYIPAGTLRSGESPMFEETLIDQALEEALETLDRATLALHLSRRVESPLARIEQTHLARDDFRLALEALENASPAIQASEAWQLWHAEAEHGLTVAIARLTELSR